MSKKPVHRMLIELNEGEISALMDKAKAMGLLDDLPFAIRDAIRADLIRYHLARMERLTKEGHGMAAAELQLRWEEGR
jgi:hypothetical protein